MGFLHSYHGESVPLGVGEEEPIVGSHPLDFARLEMVAVSVGTVPESAGIDYVADALLVVVHDEYRPHRRVLAEISRRELRQDADSLHDAVMADVCPYARPDRAALPHLHAGYLLGRVPREKFLRVVGGIK